MADAACSIIRKTPESLFMYDGDQQFWTISMVPHTFSEKVFDKYVSVRSSMKIFLYY